MKANHTSTGDRIPRICSISWIFTVQTVADTEFQSLLREGKSNLEKTF